jgi:hypothetical protein
LLTSASRSVLSGLFPLSANISLVLVLTLSALDILIALAFFLASKFPVVSFVASFFLLSALTVDLFWAGEVTRYGCLGELIESKTEETLV